MTIDLADFLRARLAEEDDLARHCDGNDECGEWVASSDSVDFCQVSLSGFPPTIAQHVAPHDPARILREVDAKRRILSHHTLSPAGGDPELPWNPRRKKIHHLDQVS